LELPNSTNFLDVIDIRNIVHPFRVRRFSDLIIEIVCLVELFSQHLTIPQALIGQIREIGPITEPARKHDLTRPSPFFFPKNIFQEWLPYKANSGRPKDV
jgi:hypothetical protein